MKFWHKRNKNWHNSLTKDLEDGQEILAFRLCTHLLGFVVFNYRNNEFKKTISLRSDSAFVLTTYLSTIAKFMHITLLRLSLSPPPRFLTSTNKYLYAFFFFFLNAVNAIEREKF